MSSGLSQAEIDALLKGDSTPADPAPADPNAMMSQEDIEAMLAGAGDDAAPAVEIPADPNAVMTPEQIEALLNGSAAPAADPAPMLGEEMPLPQEAKSPMPALAPDELLTTVETDAMGEIGNISMGTAATTLFTLLSHKVDITTPTVDLTTMRRISEEYPLPFVAVEVQYTLGLEGTNILFLREHDVKIITDLLMGGDGTNLADELSELHLSAISEVMNQMVGSSSTSLAKLMGLSIDISPPRAYTVNMVSDASKVYANLDEVIVRTSFDMVVEGLINSQIMQVTPVDFAKRMVANLVGGGATAAAGMSDAKTAPAPAPAPAPKPAPSAPVQQTVGGNYSSPLPPTVC
ncbi:hypothetical protein FACS1894217_10050 [Clostridia bacterium]|nr:hypothetical protein FACS1894217_10050 [Clostridia bacterium]